MYVYSYYTKKNPLLEAYFILSPSEEAYVLENDLLIAHLLIIFVGFHSGIVHANMINWTLSFFFFFFFSF